MGAGLMKKIIFSLLLILACVGCTPPVPSVDVAPPVQTIDSSLYNHVISLTTSLADGAIADAEYDNVDKPVILETLIKGFSVRPMVIKQPDGGVALRYKVIDADGIWRKKHAYFVFGGDKSYIRKSKS